MKESRELIDCIVIGAGVSGISVARRLSDAGKTFKVISLGEGGRFVPEPNGVNYGAYFCSKSYKNLRPFLRLSEKIRENLYQATSFNIDGLEDAYINGLYCRK